MYQKIILAGNLGRDPEVMTFDNGVKKASFSLATTESYRNKEGHWVDQTEWHNIVLWGYLAERNLSKGEQVYIEGKIRTRSWDDSNGNKRYTTEIFADKLLKLGRPARDGDGGQADQNKMNQTATVEEPEIVAPDDDLPHRSPRDGVSGADRGGAAAAR